jgi:excinuclease UvrABC nuclease subunit
MLRAAKEMEFMEAARLRDELEALRNRLKELAVAK